MCPIYPREHLLKLLLFYGTCVELTFPVRDSAGGAGGGLFGPVPGERGLGCSGGEARSGDHDL